MTQPKEEEYALSYRDIQIFARQLVAISIEESLKSGKFDLDIAKFGENEQRCIHIELRQIIRQFNSINGSTLPPQKAGRPKKGQEESA